MPSYDYRCDANGRILEVRHRITDKVRTWGELCMLAGTDPGDTPPDAPVTRLITGAQVVHSSSLRNPDAPSCSSGPCCGGGVCGLE